MLAYDLLCVEKTYAICVLVMNLFLTKFNTNGIENYLNRQPPLPSSSSSLSTFPCRSIKSVSEHTE